jgi:hypothetical protein
MEALKLIRRSAGFFRKGEKGGISRMSSRSRTMSDASIAISLRFAHGDQTKAVLRAGRR